MTNPNTQYEQIQSIISDQRLATLHAVDTQTPFESRLAYFLTSNVALASNRLNHVSMARLDPITINAMYASAIAASKLTPAIEEEKSFSFESELECFYRTGLIDPLQRAQTLFNSYKAADLNEEKITQSRKFLELGSLAFTTLLQDPIALKVPDIQNRLGYFAHTADLSVKTAIHGFNLVNSAPNVRPY